MSLNQNEGQMVLGDVTDGDLLQLTTNSCMRELLSYGSQYVLPESDRSQQIVGSVASELGYDQNSQYPDLEMANAVYTQNNTFQTADFPGQLPQQQMEFMSANDTSYHPQNLNISSEMNFIPSNPNDLPTMGPQAAWSVHDDTPNYTQILPGMMEQQAALSLPRSIPNISMSSTMSMQYRGVPMIQQYQGEDYTDPMVTNLMSSNYEISPAFNGTNLQQAHNGLSQQMHAINPVEQIPVPVCDGNESQSMQETFIAGHDVYRNFPQQSQNHGQLQNFSGIGNETNERINWPMVSNNNNDSVQMPPTAHTQSIYHFVGTPQHNAAATVHNPHIQNPSFRLSKKQHPRPSSSCSCAGTGYQPGYTPRRRCERCWSHMSHRGEAQVSSRPTQLLHHPQPVNLASTQGGNGNRNNGNGDDTFGIWTNAIHTDAW